MIRPIAVIAAIALIALNGSLHGYWSHRWDTWSETTANEAVSRIEQIPLHIGDWDGERVDANLLTLPEEVVGRGTTVRYTNRTDGTSVVVFLTCGPTEGVISHTPRICYPANGFSCQPTDLRVSPPIPGSSTAEFFMSNFTKPDAIAPTHVRVFWAWSDGTGWQIPGNPLRAFRRSPVVYKTYFIRQVLTPDEPGDGDPCLNLMAALIPKLDAELAVTR